VGSGKTVVVGPTLGAFVSNGSDGARLLRDGPMVGSAAGASMASVLGNSVKVSLGVLVGVLTGRVVARSEGCLELGSCAGGSGEAVPGATVELTTVGRNETDTFARDDGMELFVAVPFGMVADVGFMVPLIGCLVPAPTETGLPVLVSGGSRVAARSVALVPVGACGNGRGWSLAAIPTGAPLVCGKFSPTEDVLLGIVDVGTNGASLSSVAASSAAAAAVQGGSSRVAFSFEPGRPSQPL
jgi:hypothetical protein